MYDIISSSVRVEDNRLSFYFIFSYFSFIFSYFFIYLKEYKTKKTKYDTITDHMTQSQKTHTHVIPRRA